jgi:acyl-CoA thioesterase-1
MRNTATRWAAVGGRFAARYAAVAFALLLLLGQGYAWAANPVVLVVGDSLSAAYGLAEKDGWVNLLRERLGKQSPPYDVVNASISGDTTRGGLARIDGALTQFKPRIVIIELGANDGLRGLSLDGTRKNLDAMVSAVKKTNAKVLIVGIELPPNYGPVYGDQFAQLFRSVAQARSVPVVPTLMAGFGDKRDFFQPDGLHPTASAQPVMLETVWKGLAPLLKSQ